MNKTRIIISSIWMLCLVSCTKDIIPNPNNDEEPQVTTTNLRDTSISIDNQDPINVYDYEFAKLSFMETNISNNTINTSVDYPKVIVRSDYCKQEIGNSGYEGYRVCSLVDNALYDTLGNHKEYLFVEGEYNALKNTNTMQGTNILVNGKELLDIINASSKIVEMPTTMKVAFRDVFDNTGNWLTFENEDGYGFELNIFDTYFVLSINYNQSSYDVKSYTYFENTEMMKYLKEL